MKKINLFFLLAFLNLKAQAQILDNAEEAFRKSTALNKPVLLVFSGSDWCAPCIQFEKKILTDQVFQAFANEQLIVLKADFPQRKRLSKALEKQNEMLAEQYNPEGAFPYLILIKPDRSQFLVLPYANQTLEEFTAGVTGYLAKLRDGKS